MYMSDKDQLQREHTWRGIVKCVYQGTVCDTTEQVVDQNH